MVLAIELEDVTKQYAGEVILNQIQLKVMQGESVGIVGGNGSGKSLLFKIICGFERPTSGKVKIRQRVLEEQLDFPENVGVFINEPGYIELYSGTRQVKSILANITFYKRKWISNLFHHTNLQAINQRLLNSWWKD